jgi:plasmid stabilization system protein ParE
VIVAWSAAAQADLGRLHAFLARYELSLADVTLDGLIQAPDALVDFPRLGSRLNDFNPREIREFRVKDYVLRYELSTTDILIVRVFHGRENRF